MTTEEKARAYDEVLNKLRYFMAQGVDPLITRADVQDFFPELKENEDERIRKELISFIRGMLACHDKSNAERDEKYESWIAWLEKQSKNSPVLSNSSNIGKVEQKLAENAGMSQLMKKNLEMIGGIRYDRKREIGED